MKETKRKFIKIFRVELEDLAYDLDVLIKDMEQKRETGEVSNYVCQENVRVFQNEVFALKDVTEELENIDADAFSSVDEIYEAIKEKANETIKKHALIKASLTLIERKLKKVYNYVMGTY